MREVGLSLGSNLGDRKAILTEAVRLLAAKIHEIRLSPFYETAPWGKTDQGDFMNCAVIGVTDEAPHDLLTFIKEIEKQLGRVTTERWGPRLIDIDLLYLGDCVVNAPDLTLPHQDLFNRAFVLVPLCDIKPDLVLQGRSLQEALAALPRSPGDVRLFE